MKKLILIIAIALTAATSSFAYTIADVRNGNSGRFTANVRNISYMLETDGGNSCIIASHNREGSFYKSISSPDYSVNLVTGYIVPVGTNNEYFTTVYLETWGGTSARSFQVAQASW